MNKDIVDPLEHFYKLVNNYLEKSTMPSVMLTGGKSIIPFYNKVREDKRFKLLEKFKFFITDERFVPIKSDQSNQKYIIDSFFKGKNINGCNFFRFETEKLAINDACLEYEDKLPDKIDILILSIGIDGHVASIFPNTEDCNIDKTEKCIISSVIDAHGHHRLTASLNYLIKATNKIIFALGNEKQDLFNQAMLDIENYEEMACRLFLNNHLYKEIG